MAMIFDSHAHYDDGRFDSDRHELLAALPQNGVCGVLQCATDPASSERAIAMSEQYEHIYAAVGYHPENLEGLTPDDLTLCRRLAAHPKVKAIGEIGLDYYWDSSPRPVQQAWFIDQMRLAKELALPVVVHDRDAHEDTLRLLKQERPSGVLHAFSGSVEMAKEILDIGMYIGLGGVVTFQNARKTVEVAAMLPLERLLLETDAPYMTPVPFRGRRNDSTMIRFVAARIAEIRGCDVDTILPATEQNARTLFGIERI